MVGSNKLHVNLAKSPVLSCNLSTGLELCKLKCPKNRKGNTE